MLPTRVQALRLPLFSLACSVFTRAHRVGATVDDSMAAKTQVVLDYTVHTSESDLLSVPGSATTITARTHLPRVDESIASSTSIGDPAPTRGFPSTAPICSSSLINTAPDPDSSNPLATSPLPLTSSFTTPANSLSSSAVPGKARNITVAVALPISILLLFLFIALVLWWRRHSQAQFLPPGRRISEDPTLSGWARDAWALKRNEAGSLSRGHSSRDHSDSLRTSPTALIRHVRNAAGAVSRSRGPTVSSTATTTSTIQSSSQCSVESNTVGQPVAPSHFSTSNQPETHYEDTLGCGYNTHLRHPYAARTPEPYEGRPLPTVPEQLAALEQPSASYKNAPRALPSIPLRLATNEQIQVEAIQKAVPMRRPLPIPPIPKKQSQSLGYRNFSKTASGSYLSP